MVDLGVSIECKSHASRDLDLSDFPPLSGVNAGVVAVNIDAGVADVKLTLGMLVVKKIMPPSQVLAGGAKQWTNALLGNFLGKSPPLSVFQRMADKLWGREGSVEIKFLAPSVYLINFPSQRVRDWVLESGPWHIQQRAIVLRKWTPGMLPEVVSLETSPVWIKLWHVPLELFSKQGLGCDHCSIFGHSIDKCVKKDVIVVDVNTEVVNTVDKVADSVQSFVEIGEQGESTVAGDKKGECSNSLNVSTEHGASPISEVRDVSAAVGCADASLCVGNIEVGSVQDEQVWVESHNKFVVLCEVAEKQEVSPRKPRLAGTGVADLMNQLKPKAREIKAKKKKKVKEGDLQGEVLCLLETRVQERNVDSIIKARFSGWSWFNNYGEASNGRIWILVRAMGGRRESSSHESSDYDGSQKLSGAMQEFLDCQEDLDVFDHAYTGSFFTLCNFREDAPILRKLDRVFVNQQWLQLFPGASVEFLPPDCSDHCSGHLILKAPLFRPPKSFKFFNFWVEHPRFLKIVEDSWVQPSGGNPLQLLFTKLKRLKGPLKQLIRKFLVTFLLEYRLTK
ncbi:hypothetical protein V6N13_093501 [Hibiscus sabdariffa]